MKFVSISGAVAAGKTTLLHELLQALGTSAHAHEELPDRNPFITSYYANPTRWSFHTQVTFLSLYLEHPDWLKDLYDYFFFDRCLEENIVLARQRMLNGQLTGDEFHVLETLTTGIAKLMPPIDKYLYLQCSPETLVKRYHQRGRDYERDLDYGYAQEQDTLYRSWIAGLPSDRVLVISTEEPIDISSILTFLHA